MKFISILLILVCGMAYGDLSDFALMSKNESYYKYSNGKKLNFSIFVFPDESTFKSDRLMGNLLSIVKIFDKMPIEFVIVNSTGDSQKGFKYQRTVFEDGSKIVAEMFGISNGGDVVFIDRKKNKIVHESSIFDPNFSQEIEAIVNGRDVPYNSKREIGSDFVYSQVVKPTWDTKIKVLVKINCQECHSAFSDEKTFASKKDQVEKMIRMKGLNFKKNIDQMSHRLLPADEKNLMVWMRGLAL